ncbi:NirY protein [Catenovulum agarivorans DS-2]|uniref:NirY protein n=1 Tax=Catenovulum agarivorans DS-2 TaxID=1328313 RepID=W7QTF9_9ALTE|nr:LysR family transcriptional regulator [Catenovulum agarivorans]EWH12322.1 NirY protein [Catenovulum agarivorans DS-2]
MDYINAKTFLTICQVHSFSAAAQMLHVTQTTVTARIKNLEQQLGCKLFVRNKGGAKLTANGLHFEPYARQIVETSLAIKRNIPLPYDLDNRLAIGCDLTLWNPIAAKWLTAIQTHWPDLVITMDVNDSKHLYEKMQDGLIDIVISHQTFYSQNTQIDHLLDEKLVQVQSSDSALPYIFIDWGETFKKLHDQALPELAIKKLSISLGPVALQMILDSGGSGYFRTRVIQRYLRSGQLKLTPQAPEFSYPVYFVHNRRNDLPFEQLKVHLLEVFEQTHNWF